MILGFAMCGSFCTYSKVFPVMEALRREYDIVPIVVDPWADKPDVRREYGIELADESALKDMDAIIMAVAHNEYRNITMAQLDAMYAPNVKKVLIDVKGILNKKEYQDAGYLYWRL